MKNKLLIARLPLLLFLVLLSCSPLAKISVTNVQDITEFRENSFIYSLPRTRLAMSISAIRIQTIPGPYAKYAEKFLGIKDAPVISTCEWRLNTTNIESIEEPDPECFYMVQTKKPWLVKGEVLRMSAYGLLLDGSNYSNFMRFSHIMDENREAADFMDLSVKKFYVTEQRPKEKKAGNVSVLVDLPVSKPKGGDKTVEEKAREASDFVIKIRKRRFNLVSGKYTTFPEGVALEGSMRALDALERDYLSLFIGNTLVDTVIQRFYFTPASNPDLQRETICRFSNERGFLDALDNEGTALVLELKNLNIAGTLDNLQMPGKGTFMENVLYYRMPDKALARIFYNSTSLLEGELKLCQFGTIVPYCVKSTTFSFLRKKK